MTKYGQRLGYLNAKTMNVFATEERRHTDVIDDEIRVITPDMQRQKTTILILCSFVLSPYAGAVVRALASHQCFPGSIPVETL